MAENKKSFILYCDLIHMVSKMPSDKAGDLFKHILEYVNDKKPVTDDLIVQLTFEPIKQQLKRDLLKFEAIKEKRSIAGVASANKRQQMLTNVESVEQTSTNSTDNDSVNVNDNVTVNDNEIVNDIKNKGGSGNFLQIQKWIIELKETDHIFQQKIMTAGLGLTAAQLVEGLDDYEGLIAQYPAKQNVRDINQFRISALKHLKEYKQKIVNGIKNGNNKTPNRVYNLEDFKD